MKARLRKPAASLLGPHVHSSGPPQMMVTFVTLAAPMVPDPLPTLQVSPAGGVCTVTEYAAPPASGVANTKFSVVTSLVFVKVSASPPLSRRVIEAPLGKPVTVPP